MSGQSQEIFSLLARPAARDPGQNGSSVCSDEMGSPERSCSWAVTGYTPKLLIPWVLTWNEAVQEAVRPGARLAEKGNGSPAGASPGASPRDAYESISSRVMKWLAQVNSRTESPTWGWRGPLGA